MLKTLIPGKLYPESEILEILTHFKEYASQVKTLAQAIQKEHFGNGVYIRGLLEISSFCKCNCFYCGIRKDNTFAQRYRLSDEQILQACAAGYKNGFRTFVLQGGEDLYFTPEKVSEIVYKIKENWSDCAVTLSLGERDYKTYKQWKTAGADRYLLRHEAASPELFTKLHPQNQKLEERKNCLYQLKELGFQVGAGFMIGTPYQTFEHLAKDIVFLQELKPQMIGIGPFIPHPKTPFASFNAGSTELTLFLISLLRILFPKCLIPSTTALNTLSKNGREDGIKAGANVIMPNLTPVLERQKYNLYNGKTNSALESLQNLTLLQEEMNKNGYKILLKEKGDYK